MGGGKRGMSSDIRPQIPRKESKVQLRLRPAQKDLIARAAEVRQTTLTAFVVEHALDAARRVWPIRCISSFPRSDGKRSARPWICRLTRFRGIRRLLTEKSVFDGD